MKKKLLSLLLAIAIMVTSVSMGFGSLVANAGVAGGGVEAINAFSLTATECTGTNFSGNITIKSKVAGYQIKVKSITATIRYYEDDTKSLNTISVEDKVIGAVCGTGGSTFSVSGNIAAGLAGLIRYECGYNLLDASGNVVFADMTGYGYGFVSANGIQTGALGTTSDEPARPGDRYYFERFAAPNSIYVQTPQIILGSHQQTSKNGIAGASSVTATMALKGNYPDTITVRDLHWEYVEMYGEGNVETTWFEMTSIPTGYYNFTIVYRGSDWFNVEMYYRDENMKATALSKMNQYLGEGREKSYYTADSWNNYLLQLEKVALAAMAMPGPNYAFKVACQTVQTASGAAALESAKQALSPVKADYTKLNEAVEAFGKVKDSTVTVRTYNGGTDLGNESLRLYTQASVDAAVAWYNSNVNENLYKYDQKTVDGYTETVKSLTANLTYSDAVYTYLDKAINEYSTIKKSDYTTTTWAAYEGAVNNGRAVSRSLKANSQNDINTALNAIVSAKINLKYVQADTTLLKAQIETGKAVKEEYNDGNLITTADGFKAAWDTFEAAYKAAEAVKGYTIDKQAEVDSAANALSASIAELSKYRLLDTTALQKALELSLPEGYTGSDYVADSYNMWATLKAEGVSFLGKAAITYTGSDRKTYNNLEEMNRLVELIIEAYNGLEKKKANFTELDKMIAKIPADDVLALYKQEYVDAIKAVVQTIDYGAKFDEQDEVDEITLNLKYALAELTPANYRDADYDGVDAAIADAGKLDRSEYINFTLVDDAIAAVDRTKKIVDQDKVDAMEKAIRDAMAELKYIPADYSDVYKAFEEAAAIPNPDWYANYYRFEEIRNSIDWELSLDDQAQVDAYAAQIRDVIANLKLAEADYSGVRAAINESKALEPLSDFNDAYIESLDLAISKVVAGYTKDKQAEVDAMEAEIRAVLAKAEENLLPADNSALNVAVNYARSKKPADYSNYEIVNAALAAVNYNLNCRQTAEMKAQIDAIYAAVNNLKLLPADYLKVEEAITNARYACKNGPYPYTAESIQKVENEISKINWDLDIQHQAEVDSYIAAINQAVAGLTYVKADYAKLDDAKEAYEALDRDLYASLSDLDAFVATLDWNKTIDKQSEVDADADQIMTMISQLEYGPADYSVIDNAEREYAGLNKNHYDPIHVTNVELAFESVTRGLTKEKQSQVDKMAQDVVYALDMMKANIKSADLTALTEAKEAATSRITEMQATGYEIDNDTLSVLRGLIIQSSVYNANTKIDKQEAIDALVAQIIEATAKLEFVFTIDLTGTGLKIDEDGYIYGFEEGTTAADAKELIKFVGAAEINFIQMKNVFGTGTIIQFIDTKTGKVIEGHTYTVIVFGDANGDAVIDMFDVAYLTEIVNSMEKPSDIILKALDLFDDDYIDTVDHTMLIQIANMEATLMQDGTMGTY